jgi:LacI family transcriptional regulator
MAAKHLMERGFASFGFCGLEEMFWSKARCRGFSEEVIKNGFSVSFYEQPKSLSNLSWDIEQHAITQWLTSLRRPVGIMACNDDRAEHVAEGCKQAGLNVPEDVAIIGVDNDEFVCEFADPPLSSVALNSEKAGFEAAELLDEIMNGQTVAEKTILVKPTHIVVRQSTDILAIADEDVAKALAYIRKNSRNILQVEDIAGQVGISVRILQSRFQAVLGRTIRDELKKVRINEITALLRDTNMTVSQIAYQLGYSSDHNLARFFRAETKMSPVEYRRKFK